MHFSIGKKYQERILGGSTLDDGRFGSVFDEGGFATGKAEASMLSTLLPVLRLEDE